jgi:hypothetical protein
MAYRRASELLGPADVQAGCLVEMMENGGFSTASDRYADLKR